MTLRPALRIALAAAAVAALTGCANSATTVAGPSPASGPLPTGTTPVGPSSLPFPFSPLIPLPSPSGFPGPADVSSPAELPDSATIEFEFANGAPDPAFTSDMVATFTATDGSVTGLFQGVPSSSTATRSTATAWKTVSRTYGDLLALPDAEPIGDCDGGARYAVRVTDGGRTLHEIAYRVCDGANNVAAGKLSDWVTPLMETLPQPTPDPTAPSEEN